MDFNEKDYRGNVVYCRYIFDNIDVLGLDLNSPAEIQYVANKYVEKINEIRGYEADDLYEDEDVLIEVVEKAIKKFESLKRGFKSKNEISINKDNLELLSQSEDLYEQKQKSIDDSINRKLSKEKELNRKGRYSYNESYDDYGYDEGYNVMKK